MTGKARTVSFSVAKSRAIYAWEHQYLTELLVTAGGFVARAARIANMDRMHLHRLLVQHGINAGDFKGQERSTDGQDGTEDRPTVPEG